VTFVSLLLGFLTSGLSALDLTSVDAGLEGACPSRGGESGISILGLRRTSAAGETTIDDLLAYELSARAAQTAARNFGCSGSHDGRYVPEFVAVRFGVSRPGAQTTEPGDGRFVAPRLRSGSLPTQPVTTPGGGEVLIELQLDTSGSVSEAKVLRSTPPFTSLLREAVLDWRFQPARVTGETGEYEPVESRVLVAGWFRPPALYSGAAAGEPPEDITEPSAEIARPTSTTTPGYPPDGRGDQVVLVEVEVDRQGSVVEARVVRSAPGFDSVALDAARRWKFRPAQWEGEAVPSFSYIVFGFREPVTVVRP
jgi:TonB family protein